MPYLQLENDEIFYGKSFGYQTSMSGELVFQTGMVGYPESLTDPSYRRQILVLTYPLIGNYGIPDDSVDENGLLTNFESNRIWINGLVVGEYNPQYSHWKGVKTLGDWLEEHKVPGISGIDTRRLTLLIREHGTIKGRIINDDKMVDFIDIDTMNLVQEVSIKEPVVYKSKLENSRNILVYDFGIKNSQIRSLLKRGFNCIMVPWNYIPDTGIMSDVKGIFLSNGPGNPESCQEVISFLKDYMKLKNPIFGICLGHQILSLAAGATIYKMKFGNRGHNIPVRFKDGKRCLITSQNHGFGVDLTSISDEWQPLFTNANDDSNEGIIHKSLPYYSVQFHPEAKAGPEDAGFLFDIFRQSIENDTIDINSMIRQNLFNNANLDEYKKYKKVLVLGSGGLSIGQAGEFDYSGSQAIKAYKESGLTTVLINPNIATIQTSPGLADKVYSLPVTVRYVTEVIERERPDCIALSFGGQTGLNTGIQLYESGVLEKYNVDVLGTPVSSIKSAEDRQLFKNVLNDIGEKIAVSHVATTIDAAYQAADKIGYPVLVRASFALGGLGSGFASNKEELFKLVEPTLKNPDSQVIIDKSFKGWKEVEYEIVRDRYDNCISVCNMENFDPLGVHTGESIVVAPSQTLTDDDYNKLRSVAFKIVRKLKIVGECNIQYAFDPNSDDYFIIEMNPRLSRSSALASKATGYPLAYVAAKLSLGESLVDLKNSVTKDTTACFEPSLDYCVVKIPRWDLKKFPKVSSKIGSAMKSVGEVMAIARSFEEAFQKGLRMMDDGCMGFDPTFYKKDITDNDDLENPSYDRVFLIAKLLFERKYTIDDIQQKTKIDYWFLKKVQKIIDMYHILEQKSLDDLENEPEVLLKAKRRGFSDTQISKIVKATELHIRHARDMHNIRPWVKIIDTVAGEFECKTNYCYLTYHGSEHDVVPIDNEGIAVLGSGVYRIGSSVEFDWCAVNCIRQIRKQGHKAIMINYNPETVSTDYDEADRLYFDELSFETVMDIYQFENPKGIILSMGGQIPNNIAMDLFRQKVNVLGTSPENIDNAENRFKFSRMLDQIGVDQPKWLESTNLDETVAFCHDVTYPCLIRPSYVLSGAAMKVIYSDEQLEESLSGAAMVSKDYPVVVSKFIDDAKEIEVDAVANDGWVQILAISEHVENAGVHSGDATLILPSQNLTSETTKKIIKSVYKISRALEINGPFNIQFIAKDDRIMVIECNLRVSRTFPFISKTLDANFIEIATDIIVNGQNPSEETIERIKRQETIDGKIGVKVPQFSFNRLGDTDVKLGVEMVSTGEVACFGYNEYSAYLKALRASGFMIPDMNNIDMNNKPNILLSIGSFKFKKEFTDFVEILSKYFNIYMTYGTYDYYNEHFQSQINLNRTENDKEIINMIKKQEFKLIVNISDPGKNFNSRGSTLGYQIRTTAIKFNIPVITNIKCAKLLINALVDHYDEYLAVTDVDCMSSYKTIKMPLLTDMHVHFRDLKESKSGDWKSESAAALVGGVSSVMVMPNTQPSIDNYQILSEYNDIASKNSYVDYLLTILGTTKLANDVNIEQEMTSMSQLAIGMKLFLTGSHTSSEQVVNDVNDWQTLLKYWPSDRLVFLHVDNPMILMAFLFVAKSYPHHYHLCHLRTKQELEIIEKARDEGINITTEVCPHHLYINDPNLKDCVMPHLVGDDDRQYLLDNLNKIDCFASDHAPHAESGKYGFSSIEHTIQIYMRAIEQGLFDVDTLIEKMIVNPRKIFGLPVSDSDYMEVDINYPDMIRTPQYSKGKNSPYIGWNINCIIRKSVKSSETVVIDNQLVLSYPMGINLIEKVNTKPSQIEHKPIIPNIDLYNIDPTQNVLDVKLEFKDKHIISINQFDRELIKQLCSKAEYYKDLCEDREDITLLKNKTFVLAFYEPSTRTRMSFETAVKRMGGNVVNLTPDTSSIKKGETFEDTIKTIQTYTDGIILRSPEAGSCQLASEIANIPIINAGDGCGEHPTQALLDVYTIRQERGSIYNITVTFMGDLKNGRTVHSLVQLLAMYDSIRFYYVCDPELRLPKELQDKLLEINPKLEQYHVSSLEEVLDKTDVLYMTRYQKERESSDAIYIYPELTPSMLTNAKKNLIILHPLPRNDEIDPDVDIDPRACYFRQMEYGLYMRMALLDMLYNS